MSIAQYPLLTGAALVLFSASAAFAETPAGEQPPVRMQRAATAESTAQLVTSATHKPISSLTEAAAQLPPLPEGVRELRFEDFYKMPVGPQGLEISPKLKELNGQSVRLVGYFVFEDWGTCNCAPEAPPVAGKPARRGPAWMKHVVPGRIMLAPLPVTVSLGHYGLCDDLPPQVVYVSVEDRFGEPVPYRPGLYALTGKLELGGKTEPDGRSSFVHLKVTREDTFLRAGTGRTAQR